MLSFHLTEIGSLLHRKWKFVKRAELGNPLNGRKPFSLVRDRRER
jgi:hypothetical protein